MSCAIIEDEEVKVRDDQGGLWRRLELTVLDEIHISVGFPSGEASSKFSSVGQEGLLIVSNTF